MTSTISQRKQLANKAQSALVNQVIKERDKAFSRPEDADPSEAKKGDIVDEVLEDLVKATAASIGFFSEISHHRKGKKAQRANKTAALPPPETAVELDAGDVSPVFRPDAPPGRSTSPESSAVESSDNNKKADEKKTVAAFLQRHPLPAELPPSSHRLSLPVVIGQRRPEDRTRGFMRAYAPELEDAGVPQDAFLDFIDTFNKILEPSPWIQTINLADLVGTVIPEPALMAVGYVAELIADLASEAQSRFASNKFLDRANAEFFVPRGLFCLVTTWRTDEMRDENEQDDEAGEDTTGTNPETRQNLLDNIDDYHERRSKPGFAETTKGAFSRTIPQNEIMPRLQERLKEMTTPWTMQYGWVDSAPLIFPSADDDKETVTDANGEDKQKKKKKGALTRAGDWTDEHMDRHARARWATEHREVPASQIMPTSEFKSRYADPAHPAASGDWIALVTGGKWQSKKGPVSAQMARSRSRERKEKRRKEEEKKRKKGKEGKFSASDAVTSLLRKVSLFHVPW